MGMSLQNLKNKIQYDCQKYSHPEWECKKNFTKKPLNEVPSRFRSVIGTQKARTTVRKPFAPIRPNFARRVVTGVRQGPVLPKRSTPTPVRSPQRSCPTIVVKTTKVVDLRNSTPAKFSCGIEL